MQEVISGNEVLKLHFLRCVSTHFVGGVSSSFSSAIGSGSSFSSAVCDASAISSSFFLVFTRITSSHNTGYC